jgi:hypothetical protein
LKNRVNAYAGWLTINAAIVLVVNNTSAAVIAKVESVNVVFIILSIYLNFVYFDKVYSLQVSSIILHITAYVNSIINQSINQLLLML